MARTRRGGARGRERSLRGRGRGVSQVPTPPPAPPVQNIQDLTTLIINLLNANQREMQYMQEQQQRFMEEVRGYLAMARQGEQQPRGAPIPQMVSPMLVAHELPTYAAVVQAAKSVEERQGDAYVTGQFASKRPLPFQGNQAASKFQRGTSSSHTIPQLRRYDPRPVAPELLRFQSTSSTPALGFRCYHCHQMGHLIRDCPQKRAKVANRPQAAEDSREGVRTHSRRSPRVSRCGDRYY